VFLPPFYTLLTLGVLCSRGAPGAQPPPCTTAPPRRQEEPEESIPTVVLILLSGEAVVENTAEQ
jgi:hypothetical protein